ncbi:hypothetical protein YC2023_022621 [Brassica napus]
MRASTILLCGVVLMQLFVAHINAQRSKSPWQTLSGDAPLVIARGGFSGLFPDSSLPAYDLAKQTSLAGSVLWCDVQLTKDGLGICFPDLELNNASTIEYFYPNRQKSYPVNGVTTQGWFTIDFFLRDLKNASLIRGILSSFLISASRTVSIDYISSPEVNFFRKIAGRFGRKGPSFVFQFLGKEEFEPTTNRTYGSILSNLTYVKTFASGILVPKSYILPLDDKQYLLPPTSLVQDAHKAGLQVYVSGFSNDVDIAYNYSSDPVSEYLSFVDNGDFSVDGVLSDFPITASASIDCFSHIGRNATKHVDFLVISKNGASGDYPGCTDLAYEKAIKDGADVIDCSVQMSSEGKPFCSSSIDLEKSTMVSQTSLSSRSIIIPEISSDSGIYTFSLTWPEIQSLTPAISNPYRAYSMFRNPNEKNFGRIISLSKFLKLANNSTSLSSVLISVENAVYLREKQGLDVVKAVLDTLTETGYSDGTTRTKIMIQSTNSSILVDFKKKSKFETVYKVEEKIGDISDSAIEDIKKFANAVVITKSSVFPYADAFVTGKTNVVEKLQKAKLPVYVELFQNEFVSQPFDYFSDATVEINTYITGAGINGTITEFPLTAARYKRNQCLGRKETPPYMSPIQPGSLLSLVNPTSLPPAQAPSPSFTDDDVTEPPLPPVTTKSPNLIFTDDGHYKLCSQPFSCGDQRDLLYPFWIPGREECGYPGFMLNCSGEFAELTVSSVKFRILMANYDYHIISLAISDYIDNLCPKNPVNESLYQSALQFAPGTELLTILYGCPDLSALISTSQVYNYITEFQCKDDSEGLKNYGVVKNSSSVLLYGRDATKNLEQNCTTEVSIPVSESTLHTLRLDNPKKSLEQVDSSAIVTMPPMAKTVALEGEVTVHLNYPFWKPGRKACGHPEFELNCSGNFAELNISTVKFRIIDSGEMCKRNVSIPASGSALETLQRSPNTYNLKKAIEQGFKLYVNSDCERCIGSDGACGYNQTSSVFVCYCKDGPRNSSCRTHNRADLIEGIAIVIIILVGIIALVVFLCPCFRVQIFRKRKTSDERRHEKLKALIPLKHYTYAQVKKITKSFAEVVGRGGFGVVYRGTLCDGRMVAQGDNVSPAEYGIRSEEEEIAKKMKIVGLWCIQSSPSNRPPMNIVVEMMEGSLEALEVPPMPVLQQIPAARLSQSFWDSGEGSSASEVLLLSFSAQAQRTKTPPTTEFTFQVSMYPPLFITLVVFSVASFPSCFSADQQYEECRLPLRCGSEPSVLFPNITYPFWGNSIGKPNFCGQTEFELSCKENQNLTLEIENFTLRVVSANLDNKIITVADESFLHDGCPQIFNFTGAMQFTLNHNTETIFLFNCPSNNPVTTSSTITCQLSNSNLITYHAFGSTNPPQNCTMVGEIPMLASAKNLLQQSNASDQSLKMALEKGFDLRYDSEDDVCQACTKSKGICGSEVRSGNFMCLCADKPYNSSCKDVQGIAAGVTFLGLLLLSVSWFCYNTQRMKTSDDPRQQNLKALIPLKHYSYAQVKRITKSFTEVVGKGGFGTVYRGTLCDGRRVAVKILKDSKSDGEDFINEGDSGKHNRNVITSEEEEMAKKMTLVGLWCIQPSPSDRPLMNRVVEMMEGSVDSLEVPPRPVFQIPAAPFQEPSTLSEDISSYKDVCSMDVA